MENSCFGFYKEKGRVTSPIRQIPYKDNSVGLFLPSEITACSLVVPIMKLPFLGRG